MTMRILFLHSAGPQDHGQGSSALLSFMAKELGMRYKFYAPKIPDPENPAYKTWKTGLEKQLDQIDNEVILVGHSLGASVLLKYFSEVPYQKPIAGLFMVAAPYWGADGWELEEFTLKPNFSAQLASIAHIGIYHSQDDEWVPVAHATHYQAKLPAATVRIFRDRGHNFDAGLPELIEDIKALSEKTNALNNQN